MIWKSLAYEELSLADLYAAMRLRQLVFIVEQNCPYLDADGKDQYAQHLFGYENGELIAYARLLPKDVSYKGCTSIGRVVTASSSRGTGAGKDLMNEAIAQTEALFGKLPIKIGAQEYLHKFYQSFGFEQCSPPYLEDGIVHIEMLRSNA